MAPPNSSKPPLSTRLRQSFEGKRNKSDAISPTNGLAVQDPDTLRNAIDEAINGEAFQMAIAANLLT